MSKKQPVKPITPIHNKTSSTYKKKVYNAPTFHLSNKILIPAIILLFVALAFLYCKPLFSGMQLSTHDSNQYIAMSKEATALKESTGHLSFWSSRMFGGMPGYLTGGLEFPKIIKYLPCGLVYQVFRQIPDPAMEIVFLLLSGFIGIYIFTRKISFAFLGAVAIGFCTVNFVSLDAGHITKVNSIAMFLPLFASVWLTFQKKYYTRFFHAIAALF